MKDSLYDLTKKLFTMSDEEGKELLFNETNIYDYDRVKMMISAFVQKKESLIIKSGNKLRFDLKENINEVWNIMFLYNYIEHITDKSIEEVKRNISILESSKKDYYKNRNISNSEEERLYWDELININKVSLDESKSILKSYLNAKAECAVILENKNEVEDLTFILGKLESAIQRIHALRNVLSHKNAEFEYETQNVIINEPSRKIIGRIPKEYLSGFVDGCINSRNEDKHIVLKTNSELEELYSRYNIKIQSLNHFFFNVTPERLSLLLEHVSFVDRLSALPHQLYTCNSDALLAIFNLRNNYNIPIDVSLKYLGFVDKYDLSIVFDKIRKYEDSEIAQKFIRIFGDGRGILERLEIFDYCIDNNYLDENIFKFLSDSETFFKGSKGIRNNINNIKFVIKYFLSNNINVNFLSLLKYIAFSSYAKVDNVDVLNINNVLNSSVFEVLKLSSELGISSDRYFNDILYLNNTDEYLNILKRIKSGELDIKFSDYFYYKIALDLKTLIDINCFCDDNKLDILCFKGITFDSFDTFKNFYDLASDLNFPVTDVGSKFNIDFISSISLHPVFKTRIDVMLKFIHSCSIRTFDILKKDLFSRDVDLINEHYSRYEDFYNNLFNSKDSSHFDYICSCSDFNDDFDDIIEFYNVMKRFDFSEDIIFEARRWFLKPKLPGSTFSFADNLEIFINKYPVLKNNFNYLQNLIFDCMENYNDYFGEENSKGVILSKFDIFDEYGGFLFDRNILPGDFYSFVELVNIFNDANMKEQIQHINTDFIKYYNSRYKNNVLFILDYYNYDLNLFYKVSKKVVTSKFELIEPMLKIHDQNMMKSLFGTNDHKLISLYSYVHSVMSSIIDSSTIDSVPDELGNIFVNMGYNSFEDQRYFIRRLRNAVCHFRFRSNGDELNLWDTADNVTVDFMINITYEDLLEITRLIELSYSLEYIDINNKTI